MTGLVASIATLALLTGCAAFGGSGSDSGDRTTTNSQSNSEEFVEDTGESGASADSAPSEAAPSAPGDDSQLAERDIITTTSADIRVEDVPGSIGKLEQLVTKYDGRVEARTERTSDAVPEAYLTIRIPADQNDAFITELKELGEVMQLESQALDVTLERVDLDARISSLQSSIASLEAMLEQATNVEDMLDIEQELSERQAELQSLEAQLKVLSEDVAMSTVYVNLSTDATPQPIDEPSGFFAGLVEGWNDFVESLNNFVTDFGYALPGLVLLLIILALLWFLVIRPFVKRARSRSVHSQDVQSQDVPGQEVQSQDVPGQEMPGQRHNNPDEPTNSDLPPLPKLD